MAMKRYTHTKGFNVTSLFGIEGIYIFHNSSGAVNYIGKCNDDFKNRINSHCYGNHGKLNDNIKYMRVIVADREVYPIDVLEHLFIWYFDPMKNKALWFFKRAMKEKQVKQIADEHNLKIKGSLRSFILSFESILIEREWEDNFKYKRYGEIETFDSKRITCCRTNNCLCFNCLVNNRC